MARIVRLDRLGMSAMLKSTPVRLAISEKASQIEATVRQDEPIVRHSAEVVSESYTTDRAASAVLIKHPIGMGIEAKYGTLNRAASAAGLQVRKNRS